MKMSRAMGIIFFHQLQRNLFLNLADGLLQEPELGQKYVTWIKD